MKFLLIALAFFYSANAQSVVLQIAANGNSTTAQTCASQHFALSTQMWSNSSVSFYVFVPNYGSSCITQNYTSLAPWSFGPAIVYNNVQVGYATSPNFCFAWVNPGGTQNSVTYQQTLTCYSQMESNAIKQQQRRNNEKEMLERELLRREVEADLRKKYASTLSATKIILPTDQSTLHSTSGSDKIIPAIVVYVTSLAAALMNL